ncbi:MAG: hypothetical protein LUF35_01825 [Lachnospiraceae bacterium]|nr:hypothetical protein [Lachnospiraceae bacterium]
MDNKLDNELDKKKIYAKCRLDRAKEEYLSMPLWIHYNAKRRIPSMDKPWAKHALNNRSILF